MKKRIYVATYENSCGEGKTQIFSSNQEAKDWLRKNFVRDFLPDVKELSEQEIKGAFHSHSQYGAHSCRIWVRSV